MEVFMFLSFQFFIWIKKKKKKIEYGTAWLAFTYWLDWIQWRKSIVVGQ